MPDFAAFGGKIWLGGGSVVHKFSAWGGDGFPAGGGGDPPPPLGMYDLEVFAPVWEAHNWRKLGAKKKSPFFSFSSFLVDQGDYKFPKDKSRLVKFV